MSKKFLSLSFAPPGSKMNETFSEHTLPMSQAETPKQSSCQFQEILKSLDGRFITRLLWAQCEQGTPELNPRGLGFKARVGRGGRCREEIGGLGRR